MKLRIDVGIDKHRTRSRTGIISHLDQSFLYDENNLKIRLVFKTRTNG